MGTSRSRSRTGSAMSGSMYNRGLKTTQYATWPDYSESCNDFVGFPDRDNPFFHKSSKITGGRLNGSSGGLPGYEPRDFPCNFCRVSQLTPDMSTSVMSSYSTALIARSGLSKPHVNIPVFIGELKDIPRMLKHAGDLLHKLKRPSELASAKEAAAATLAYQFGWAPLMSDIRKMINFHDIVTKRHQQIDNAFDNPKGTRRSTKLDSMTSSSVYTGSRSYGASIGSHVVPTYIETTDEVWGVCWWKPTSRFRALGSDAAKANAFREALGLNKRNIPLTVWKLLPWTWLTDWVVNVSDAIQAANNQVDYYPSRGTIMAKRVSTYTINGLTFVWPGTAYAVSCSTFVNTVTTKQRLPVLYYGAIPRMRLPYLDNFKLSVLGSLSILRIGK